MAPQGDCGLTSVERPQLDHSRNALGTFAATWIASIQVRASIT